MVAFSPSFTWITGGAESWQVVDIKEELRLRFFHQYRSSEPSVAFSVRLTRRGGSKAVSCGVVDHNIRIDCTSRMHRSTVEVRFTGGGSKVR